MGDRTYVTLTVLKTHAQRVAEIYDTKPSGASLCAPHHPSLAHFVFDEVNYGELHDLDELQVEGIAFDSSWERGYEYGPGVDSCRFTETGECIRKTVYDGDDLIAVQTLQQLLDQPDPEALAAVRVLVQEILDDTAILPWKNQATYGQLYRTRRLITPAD